MRDFFYQELRDCNRTISRRRDARIRKNGEKILVEIVEVMCNLADIARQRGLLSMETVSHKYMDIFNGRYLKFMIQLIVDGEDADLVEELGMAKFFSANLSGYEALHYLVMLYGILVLQDTENPGMVEKKMLALVSDEVVEQYNTKKNEYSDIQRLLKGGKTEDPVAKYYQGEIAVVPGDEFYFPIKVTDYAIISFEDKEIQAILKEVDTSVLALAMAGLSGEARHRIFDNLSSRLANMIAEDMDFMGPVKLRDVADAVYKIFNTIVNLIDSGKVNSTDGKAFCLFAKIFDVSQDGIMEQKKEEADRELYNLMEEYNSISCRMIESPLKNNCQI